MQPMQHQNVSQTSQIQQPQQTPATSAEQTGTPQWFYSNDNLNQFFDKHLKYYLNLKKIKNKEITFE